MAYEVETVAENEDNPPVKGKEFVFLRDKGEKEPVFKQFEFILQDEYGEPRLDHEGKKIVVIGPSPNEVVSRVFLTKPDERGNMKRARVVELINKFDDVLDKDPLQCKFRVEFEKNTPASKDTYLDDIMSYNDILDYVERENNYEDGDHWRFRKIINHSLIPGKKGRDGKIEVQIVWETGATSTETFDALKKDIPVDLAIYAKENNQLELDGWKTLKRLVDRSKLTERLFKQAKLHSLKYSPKYKYGFEVPKNYKNAERLDIKNGNDDWMDANKLEHEQLKDYGVFTDKGKFAGCKIPSGYQLIQVHTICNVKVDGWHKARVVADGHLTATPIESVYSGVVSLRGLRTCLFIGELDGMEPWETDIGNAYLEALTSEKVCIRAEPEFGDLEGHLLIIYKALYGLKTSGEKFGQLLQECLMKLGFILSLDEVSIYMRKCPNGNHYEYVVTYVDDLTIIMKDP